MFRLVCMSIPHLSSRWNWKKMAGSKWTSNGVRVPRTLDYPPWAKICINVHRMITMHICPRHIDGQTDGQTNIIAIVWRFVLTNALCTKNTKPSPSWEKTKPKPTDPSSPTTTAHMSVLMTEHVVHSTAQNSSDNLLSYSSHNYQRSDAVYWRGRGSDGVTAGDNETSSQWCTNKAPAFTENSLRQWQPLVEQRL